MTNITEKDIEITQMDDVYCDECKETLSVISGYFNDELMYSMDLHDLEDLEEVTEEVIAASIEVAKQRYHKND